MVYTSSSFFSILLWLCIQNNSFFAHPDLGSTDITWALESSISSSHSENLRFPEKKLFRQSKEHAKKDTMCPELLLPAADCAVPF